MLTARKGDAYASRSPRARQSGRWLALPPLIGQTRSLPIRPGDDSTSARLRADRQTAQVLRCTYPEVTPRHSTPTQLILANHPTQLTHLLTCSYDLLLRLLTTHHSPLRHETPLRLCLRLHRPGFDSHCHPDVSKSSYSESQPTAARPPIELTARIMGAGVCVNLSLPIPPAR